MKTMTAHASPLPERGWKRISALVSMWVALAACSPQGPQFKSIDITGADYAQSFELKDQRGQVRRLDDFKGKVVVVFFGYTQCPDVCPTSLSELAQAKQALGAQGDRLQGIFITVDPQRDTAPLLQAYMDHFDPSFVALIPTPEELPALAQHFKVYYKRVEGKTPTSYTVDHMAGHYIYDPQGRLRLFSRYGSGAAAIAADVKTLLERP